MFRKKITFPALIFSILLICANISYAVADNITDYSLLAVNSLQFKKEAKILSGHVGANYRAISFALDSKQACNPDPDNNIFIAKEQNDHLVPGAYGDITVRKGGTLILGRSPKRRNEGDSPSKGTG